MEREKKNLTPTACQTKTFCFDQITDNEIKLLNQIVQKRVFKIRGGSTKEQYPINSRIDIGVTLSGVDCKWSCGWFGYGWDKTYVRTFLHTVEPPKTVAPVVVAEKPAIVAPVVPAIGSTPPPVTNASRSLPTPTSRNVTSAPAVPTPTPTPTTSGVDVSALNAQFSSLPAYFDKDFATLAGGLAKFGEWTDGGKPFKLEFNRAVVDFDAEVHEQNCEPAMKGKLLKNCGLLIEAAFAKISSKANKREFAAACPKRTIRFELHDNYDAARRRWIGVPESDLRSGALVFMCTIDSFLPSRVAHTGDDIDEELNAIANPDNTSDMSSQRTGETVVKECSLCQGRGLQIHNACSGRGCVRCAQRGTTGEKCKNCHGKGRFEYAY